MQMLKNKLIILFIFLQYISCSFQAIIEAIQPIPNNVSLVWIYLIRKSSLINIQIES